MKLENTYGAEKQERQSVCYVPQELLAAKSTIISYGAS